MGKSKLKDHKQNKKTLVTPFNHYLGDKLELKTWHYRLPELLWLGVIINKYGHTEGLIKCHQIMDYMEENSIDVKDLKITTLLNLDSNKKEMLFDYVNIICEDKILDCLCLVIDDEIFRNKFYNIQKTSESKIDKIKEVLKESFFKYSDLGCDIRFFFVYHLVYNGKLKLQQGSFSFEVLTKYYNTAHTEQIMKMYKSSIISLEVAVSMMDEDANEYSNTFWERVSNFSECELYYTDFENGDKDRMDKFYNDVKTEFQNLMSSNFEKKLDDKFIVLTGQFAYVIKILNDVCSTNLHNTVSARILLRTIIDVLVNMKYLLYLESDNPNVWQDFQIDGLGKYKLIYKRIEEKGYEINEKCHLPGKMLEFLVNDGFDEEFMNINLGYFNKTKIVDKFESIGERELFDTLYDYDVSYSHAFWGAVRESSMLKCDNVLHQLHVSADYTNEQTVKSTEFDYICVVLKIMKVISSQYEGISDDFFENYEVKNEKDEK